MDVSPLFYAVACVQYGISRDELTMSPDLRKAHQANGKAVMQAYGFLGKLNTELACVAELMKMYQKLVGE